MPAKRAIGLIVDTIGSYGREVLHGVMEFCHPNPHWVVAMEPRQLRRGPSLMQAIRPPGSRTRIVSIIIPTRRGP